MNTIYSTTAAIVNYKCPKSKQSNIFNLFLPGPWSYPVPCPLQVNQLESLQLCGATAAVHNEMFSYNEGRFWKASECPVR